jgi:hypothetical protein
MKKNIIIPRKDHEVYFIPATKRVKRKALHTFISGRLRELHPGFSATTVFDVKKITLKNKTWYVTTVMLQETLIEYRVLHRGASFFTPTGLLVNAKDFVSHPVYILPDETIGYDAEHETPVSVPGIASGYKNSEPLSPDRINDLLERVCGFQGIFKKKAPFLFYILPVIVLLAVPVLFLSRGRFTADLSMPAASPPPQPEEIIRLHPLPSAFECLAQISSLVKSGNGIIHQAQYDEILPVLWSLNLGGIEPGLFLESVNSLPYVASPSISDIRYTDGKPRYTASLSLYTDFYHIPDASPFLDRETLFAVLSALRTLLRDYRVHLVSETLPQPDNDYCAVSLTVSASDFIKTIETIETELDNKRLRIRRMTVSYVADNTSFLLVYSFSPYRETDASVPLLSGDETAILPAFGYTPAPAVQKPAAKTDYSAYIKVGVIYDEDGTVTTYYRDAAGKIITSEE